jgi:hypothetical protein
MILPFSELLKWWDKRQKYLEWTNKTLEDKSKVPLGTINRIKGGDYPDCKYSTIRSILIALIGGTTDEFPCTDLVEKELKQMDQLEKQAAKLSVVEAENEMLKNRLHNIDEQHRQDIRIIKQEFQEQKEEYKETICFLREELKARRSLNQTK